MTRISIHTPISRRDWENYMYQIAISTHTPILGMIFVSNDIGANVSISTHTPLWIMMWLLKLRQTQ